MDILYSIQHRRSIRRYMLKMVGEKELAKVLEAARWAPSAGNVQDWAFVIVRDKKKKDEIASACMEQNWIAKAPVVIIVCSNYKRMGILYGKDGAEHYTYMDCAAAIENMMLTAYDLGLGTCWVGGLFDTEKIARVLKIPLDELKVISVLTLGYPAERPAAPVRKDLKDMVYFEEYSKKVRKQSKNVRA